MQLPTGTKALVAAFATSGAAHLAKPEWFGPLVPPALGDPKPWVIGSGLAELTCAGGLASKRSWAPAATAATLAVIWVGNGYMAVDWQRSRRPGWMKAVAWARLPLQVPMIVAALRSPRS